MFGDIFRQYGSYSRITHLQCGRSPCSLRLAYEYGSDTEVMI